MSSDTSSCIPAAPLASEAAKRPRRSADAGDWTAYCASMHPSELAALDAVVDRFKAAGVRRMSRSWLIRIAVQRLDLDALQAELLAVPR